MRYAYGMRLRPVGIGCQPVGFIGFVECKRYHNVVYYKEKLSQRQLDQYEMDFLGGDYED